MSVNRRRHDRYLVDPGYTPVAVRLPDDEHFSLSGHAYDISEGGCCFELDVQLEPGARIDLKITIPGREVAEHEPREATAVANVIRIGDIDDPGPVTHAAAFHRFTSEVEKEALMEALRNGRYSIAA
jgi:hypothetical protein